MRSMRKNIVKEFEEVRHRRKKVFTFKDKILNKELEGLLTNIYIYIYIYTEKYDHLSFQ